MIGDERESVKEKGKKGSRERCFIVSGHSVWKIKRTVQCTIKQKQRIRFSKLTILIIYFINFKNQLNNLIFIIFITFQNSHQQHPNPSLFYNIQINNNFLLPLSCMQEINAYNEQIFRFHNTQIFNTKSHPQHCLSQNASLKLTLSFPSPKFDIPQLSLSLTLNTQNFNKSILIANSYNYKSETQSYCIILEPGDFKMIDKLLNRKQPDHTNENFDYGNSLPLKQSLSSQSSHPELQQLQEQITSLQLSTPLLTTSCTMKKPYEKQQVSLKIIQQNHKYYILLEHYLSQITQELDFHFNKFINTLSWYHPALQKAITINMLDNKEFLKLEKTVIEIYQKIQEVSYSPMKNQEEYESGFGEKKSVNSSNVWMSDDKEMIFKMLFGDELSFDNNIVLLYDSRSEIESLNLEYHNPKMIVEQETKKKSSTKSPKPAKTKSNQEQDEDTQITTGAILVSRTYNYILVLKNKFFCIYLPTPEGMQRHNEIFMVTHSEFGKLTPMEIHFVDEERCIVFGSQNSNILSVFDVENNILLDSISLSADKKTTISDVQVRGNKIYALTTYQLHEIIYSNQKLHHSSYRTFNRSWKLRSLLITPQNNISTGSQDGILRVYSDLSQKKSLNNFNLNKPILDISICSNNIIMIVTTKQKLFMFVMSKDPFTKRLTMKEKNGTYLQLEQEDRERFKIKEFDYKIGRLIVRDAYVVTYTGGLLILWEVKKVLKRKEKAYKIVDLKEKILGLDLGVTDKEIVVNMENNIEVVKFLREEEK